MRSFTVLMSTLLLTIIAAGCGEKEKAPVAGHSGSYLSATLGGVDRSTEPRTYVGESLYEHIDGGAELYHSYGFAEVTTAYYAENGTEVIVDIYEFDSADNAFGLYSSLRPDDARILSLGVEGFTATGSTVFVKGPFVVKLTGFDDSRKTTDLIAALASPLAKSLPGTTDLPEMFGLFPGMFALANSERMFAEAYMGQQSLTDVYTQDFALDADTLRLLLAEDKSGGKFLQWTSAVEIDSALVQAMSSLPFDDGNVLAFNDSYHGAVVAGLKSGYLLGVVNYTEIHEDFLNAWLEELPEP